MKPKRRKTYESAKHKTFRSALIYGLENHFGLIGSGKVLELLADFVLDLIRRYFPEKVQPGTTVISAIAKDAPKGHHRGVRALPMVPVKLDVINHEIIERYSTDKVRQIKKDYVIHLFKQAYRQNCVLSCADVALLLKMSSATISKYVRDYMEITDDIVPTRGFVHDIGPSISHKGIIVGKFLQGVLPDTIARQTNHSQKAVDRYIKDYERIKICLKRKMKVKTISHTTALSKRLIQRYAELYHAYEAQHNEKN